MMDVNKISKKEIIDKVNIFVEKYKELDLVGYWQDIIKIDTKEFVNYYLNNIFETKSVNYEFELDYYINTNREKTKIKKIKVQDIILSNFEFE